MDLKSDHEERGIDLIESLLAWLANHTQILYVLIGVLSVLLIGLTVYAIQPVWSAPEPGGVDGCITDILGNPLTGTVKVGTRSKPIYNDGCFFFKSLAPGTYHMKVVTTGGKTLNKTFKIVSDQAISLGTITVP